MDHRPSASAVLTILVAISLCLLVGHVAVNTLGLVDASATYDFVTRLTDMNDETSVSTWYSATLLFVAAWLLFEISLQPPNDRRLSRMRWAILAVVFLFLSCDEACAIHEHGDALHRVLQVETKTTFLWTLPYGIFVLVLAVVYLPFLRALPRRTRYLFLTAGAVFLAGAIGLELLAAAFYEIDKQEYESITVPAEELLEMLGTSIFIYALLGFCGGKLGEDSAHDSATEQLVRQTE